MNIEQLSKTSFSTDFFNKSLLSPTTEKNCSWYVLPGFTQSETYVRNDRAIIVDIAAVLFGMKYPFEQLILQFSKSNIDHQNKMDKFFFLVKKTEHTVDTTFHQDIQKICHYFQIKPNCFIEFIDNQTTLSISDLNVVKKVNDETQKVTDLLMTEFWPLFKDQHQQILDIRSANETEAVSEPQTNFGRLARQLKANQILEQLKTKNNSYETKRLQLSLGSEKQ